MGRSELAPPPLRACDTATILLALGAPQAGVADREFYPDLASKAAVLLYSLAKSQACPDGNKRLAVLLTETFLGLNLMTLDAGEDDLAERVLAVAESDKEDRPTVLRQLTSWMEDRIAALKG